MIRNLIITFLCTTLYTIGRYVFFGNVSVIHLPVYLLNKSLAMASVFFLFYASFSNFKHRSDGVLFWGRASWHSALIHILLSLSILSKAYYSKFFGLEKMNLSGELTVLFGVLAIYCFWRVPRERSNPIRLRTVRVLSSFLIATHLVGMGILGWLKVDEWHGGLPPISLISFVLSVLSLVLFLRAKEKKAC